MKTKIIFSLLLLLAGAITVSAQITREQADEIAINYAKSNLALPFELFVNPNAPTEEGFSMTTTKGESIRAKYACWVYFINYAINCTDCLGCRCPQYFLLVKEDNGSTLEIIVSHSMDNLRPWLWEQVQLTGLIEPENTVKQLYPNPVEDYLNLPCNGENIQVVIYDLNGTRLFFEMLSGENVCQLNVSFLKAGVYLVNVGGETYRIIKK
jgi:hypothetical protein